MEIHDSCRYLGISRNQLVENSYIWTSSEQALLKLVELNFGPVLSFGRAIAKILSSNEDINLTKYAVGGTALYNDYTSPYCPHYGEFGAGHSYKKGIEHRIVGMLQLQEESDIPENKGENYEANLSTFIAPI